ncbi:hypothetical protein EMPG_10059 [Blastomyces silverae]|uniref:Uncharacterized protein n=1 Tax=Blastomyces silverae TaxID=2060906 RepID=A0A0H1BBD3_9EURO|nr:hypothetical protein EMPG_10059 [Blastomyces silverae]
MQATNKRKATDEDEGQQEDQGEQRPRKLPERSSRASDINYDVREYYRGIQLDEKIYSTSSQKKDTPRSAGPGGTSHLNAQPAACTPPAQRAVTPTPTWESCFECIQQLCRNPRVMKCQKGPDSSKCRHCDATHKACLKIPQALMPRLAKIQKIASSIITSPSALGWSGEVSRRREKRLSEEYTIFQKEMETHISGADMAISPRASHNVSGVSGSRTAVVGALVNATDPTPTAISGGAGSVMTPDRPFVITTLLPSPFRAVKTESPLGSSPVFKTSPTAKMPIMPPNVTDEAAATSSPPFFAHLKTNSDGSNGESDDDDLKFPTPTRSPPALGQNPAPAAQIENQLRAATAEANTVGPSIRVAAEENATGGDIQAASTDLNAAPFNLGAELLTVFGSIERNLGRIADALEAKNRHGNCNDGDSRIGGEIIANRAYWE